MKIKIFYFLLLISTTQILTAQKYAKVEDTDILNEQEKVLKSNYPHLFKTAVISEVLKIDDSYSIVRYFKDSVYYESIVNSGRKDMLLLETSKLISKDELPEIVRDAFIKKHNGQFKMEKQYVVERPSGGKLFRVDYMENEEIISEYFDHKGGFASNPF